MSSKGMSLKGRINNYAKKIGIPSSGDLAGIFSFRRTVLAGAGFSGTAAVTSATLGRKAPFLRSVSRPSNGT